MQRIAPPFSKSTNPWRIIFTAALLMEMGGAVWWKLLKSNVPTDWCGYHQCGSEQSISSPWWNLICAKCNSAPVASLKKCQRGGDKDILRAGKGNLSDKCGHLPPSNHPKQQFSQNSHFLKKSFPFGWQSVPPPLVYIGSGCGAIFQKPFLRRLRSAKAGTSGQSAISLPASHDTIGQYWTSGTALFNSLRLEPFFSWSSPLI